MDKAKELNNDQQKNKSLKKVLIKTSFAFLIALIIFPIVFTIGLTENVGRILSFVFYSIFAISLIYEFTKIMPIHKATKFYIVFLVTSSFIFPLKEIVDWLTISEASIKSNLFEITKNIWLFKFFYPGLGFALYWFLISIPFVIEMIYKKRIKTFFSYLSTLVVFFLISIAARLLIVNTHSHFWFSLVLICGTISADTFAYFGGMIFKNKIFKRKLAPKISPNKTIEGAIVGYICSFLVCFLPFYFANLEPQMPWWIMQIIIPLFLPIFAILGDLLFSWIKRKVHIKDFANIVPGHGGLLDRFDSLIVVTIVFMPLLLI